MNKLKTVINKKLDVCVRVDADKAEQLVKEEGFQYTSNKVWYRYQRKGTAVKDKSFWQRLYAKRGEQMPVTPGVYKRLTSKKSN